MIRKIKLKNFRNYDAFSIETQARQIVFTGPNGSGKTNLLEAIYFLSILRSFRSVSGREIVRIGERFFELYGSIIRGSFEEELRVLQSISGKRETFIGSNKIRRSSEFIREFRAVVFVPEDRNIPGGSSSYRRRFFDMLISMLDTGYLADLSEYARALAQRNRSLKRPARTEIVAAFEPELALRAPRIARQRRVFGQMVCDEVNRLLREHDSLEFGIRFRSEYPEDTGEYLARLEKGRERDILRGCTQMGPQLDEFEFTLNGKLVRSYASTGQIRILSLLLKLAEFNLVRRSCTEKVVVLADDVTGELDAFNRDRFLDVISDADQQFFTFTEFPRIGKLKEAQELKVVQQSSANM